MAAFAEFSSPHKFFQESAKEIKDMCNHANKQMTPLVQKYILGRTTSSSALLNSQAGQQVDNLVWQQEMFHRVLKLQGLVQEGLLQEMELRHCRKEILTGVASEHPNGEWTDFTRDKLLFLQDLFQAGCISEDEYHASKSPIIQRLAKQGALIDSEDFVMLLRAPPARGPGAADHNNSTSTAPPNIIDDASSAEDAVTDTFGATANGDESSPHVNVVKKAPIKKMLEAMSILKNTTKPTWGPDGPTREAPDRPVAGRKMVGREIPDEHEDADDIESLTALYASPPPTRKASLTISESMSHRWVPECASQKHVNDVSHKSGMAKNADDFRRIEQVDDWKTWRMGSLLSGLVRKFQGESDNESYLPLNTEDHDTLGHRYERDEVSSLRILRAGISGQDENTTTVKKRNARGTPTNLFVDKALGANIKAELARIRTEISQSNSTQTFTNDQIDDIATRLPVDKVELQKFFPKTWCDKHGDRVLEVVHKEFKEHLGEGEEQKRTRKRQQQEVKEVKNHENSDTLNIQVQSQKQGASPFKEISKANFVLNSTTGNDSPYKAKVKLPLHKESPNKENGKHLRIEQETNVQLSAETQQKPLQRVNVTYR